MPPAKAVFINNKAPEINTASFFIRMFLKVKSGQKYKYL
jgi:hypothetical protein